ncbi:hypothetical protein VU00_12322 [Candidatus Electrothrix marina]|uniref:Uncharacterized protein n=1 Tax=Candidatus Electrothrix marina TaxID=1859130 RepID=A0A444J951_9BACT|nr:hypothetical protein VU00_12322 [Candidatus Electrothrix marina]
MIAFFLDYLNILQALIEQCSVIAMQKGEQVDQADFILEEDFFFVGSFFGKAANFAQNMCGPPRNARC